MEALVGTFNQERVIVRAFSMIVKTDCETETPRDAIAYLRNIPNWPELKNDLSMSMMVNLNFQGVQNRASRISKIPTTGLTKWTCSVSAHGFVTSETMLDIVGDLRDHIVAEEIPTPVIMFMDGYKAHYSVAVWDFCKVIIL